MLAGIVSGAVAGEFVHCIFGDLNVNIFKVQQLYLSTNYSVTSLCFRQLEQPDNSPWVTLSEVFTITEKAIIKTLC